MNRVEHLKAVEEDLYSGYNEYPSTFDIKDLENDEIFQAALLKSSHGRKNLFKPGTGYRTGLKSGYNGISGSLGFRGMSRNGLQTGASRMGTATFANSTLQTGQTTAAYPQTGMTEADLVRPMTAVRGAGYTSHGRPGTSAFDPGRQRISSGFDKREETAEEKIKKIERQIMELIETSCILQSKDQRKQALDKAKEASSKERHLIRLQENSGLSETHNLDLTFLVLFNLALQYDNNKMYNEALNTYQVITKNKMFNNASRLKMNMGNIYFQIGEYNKAIKMYRMAIDQVPNTHKDLRIKIMHNIGSLFIKTGDLTEACNSFELIMQEKPDFRAGLQLVQCYHILNDPEKMKKAFQLLLNIPINIDNDKYNQAATDDPLSEVLLEAIKSDDLRQWEKEQQQEAGKSILTAAKLISPSIEDNYTSGYNWCLEAVKSSKYASLAGDLDLDKIIMLLKQKDINGANEILNTFQDKEPRIASIAANNLSFLTYLQGDYDQAEKWGENAKDLDSYNAASYVNLGNVCFARRQLDQAKQYYEVAYENDSTCVEALYNLGLVSKELQNYEESLGYFMKLETILRHDPPVLYQLAHLNQMIGDVDQATEWYLQLLGLVPSDPGILQELGQLFEREGDKQQAFQYHYDSYRYFPSNFHVLDWLGSHYMALGIPEKAIKFLKRAALVAPNEPKWQLLVASCYKKTGNHHKAVEVYKKLHRENPDNVEFSDARNYNTRLDRIRSELGYIEIKSGTSSEEKSLRPVRATDNDKQMSDLDTTGRHGLQLLVRLASELGLKEAGEYALELKRAEKAKEVRDRIGSSRPGSRRSSGSGSRSSGFSSNSPTPGKTSPTFGRNSLNSASFGKYGQTTNDTLFESDEIFESNHQIKEVDIRYDDQLGPNFDRPRTSAGKKVVDDDFGDEELGDLLPE